MLSSLLFRKKRDRPLANPMQAPRPPLITISPEPLGLKTIADSSFDSPLRSNCVKRTFVASSRSPYLPPLSAEDVNGTGDNDDLEDEDGAEDEDNACWATYGRRRRCRRFPPPIPLLARTGNLTCHMPWVLKRIYKEDGRLVIQEVPVKHHEYFRARRRDGRLTLQLVELDDHQSNQEEIARETTAVMDSHKRHDTSSSSSVFVVVI